MGPTTIYLPVFKSGMCKTQHRETRYEKQRYEIPNTGQYTWNYKLSLWVVNFTTEYYPLVLTKLNDNIINCNKNLADFSKSL
jgi:hypothetical protein